MPIDEVTLVRICGKCRFRIETFSIKKDNMMMFSKETVWCPQCQSDQPEIRDVAGRQESIDQEVNSYPKAVPAKAITPPKDSASP
jgi:Zn finger protein HypA/HybF involved in hydrogenase expression